MNQSAIDENKNCLIVAKCHSCVMESPNSLSFDVSRNSTNYLSCSCTQIQHFENGITKFIESKYEAFEFAPAFDTTCLNIIQPESIGFQGIEGSTFHFNRERASNKKLNKEEQYISSSHSRSSQFNFSSVIHRGSINSDEFYKDECLSHAFSSCIDD